MRLKLVGPDLLAIKLGRLEVGIGFLVLSSELKNFGVEKLSDLVFF